MPISGLVATLSEAPEERAHALAELSSDPRITVGTLTGAQLPLVTETPTADDAEALAEHIGMLHGVSFVNVVSVDFSDVTLAEAEVTQC